jgi:hypothetical protein
MVRKGSPVRVRRRACRFAGFSHRALIGSGDRGTPEEHGSAGSRGERLLGPSTHPPRPARRTSSFRVMRLLPFSVSAFFAGDSRALPAGPSRVSTLACRTSPAVALASSCWQRRRPPPASPVDSSTALAAPPAPSARPRQVRRGRSRDHERCRVRMVEPDELRASAPRRCMRCEPPTLPGKRGCWDQASP